MYTFNFEKLEVWPKSRLLSKKTYLLTQEFPETERFGLIPQLRRAVISVCSNIAEGSSRWSKKEKVHFYNVAFSSLMETMNQLILANDLKYIDNNELSEMRSGIHIISMILINLTKSMKSD
ncbi:MAG TPA: four helix bundle protein [Bacteroidales bacterium]|jgi:four helix bundle protein|nr:four helix bundle protein [Bacteroidales bacterium]OQB60809.1 MAG: hypothetical protein BWX96_02001 [Bacteroidetes bacterium ADurb.Bin145]NMD02999.1 four helix bundle protein [Bacteroidales bacterium]HOU02335.1 four helix bundle protein [Bacteroidales bacterium]HQG62356.1 four helix bundle protein [Bacteroidales bacterium]